MIRCFVRDDLPAVRRLIDATTLFPSEMLNDMVLAFLEGSSPEVWLVSIDVEPVGIAYCAPERMTEGTWNLYLIAVHPDRQRCGHGDALIRAVERAVVARDGRVLLIETSGLASFAGQRTFYGSRGYAEEARIRDFYQAGEDKVVFRKALTLTLRPARAEDVAALQAIELDAAGAYAVLPETRFCLDLPTRKAEEHKLARDQGLATVAEVGGRIIGFVLAVLKDGRAHILECAVSRQHQGRGYGRRMLAVVEAWAREVGSDEVTLTTFRDVPWNAPFYRSLGYQDIEISIARCELGKVIEDEKRAGCHQAPRVAMSKRIE